MIDNKFAKAAVVRIITFLSSNQYIFATKVFTTTKYAKEDTYLQTVEQAFRSLIWLCDVCWVCAFDNIFIAT